MTIRLPEPYQIQDEEVNNYLQDLTRALTQSLDKLETDLDNLGIGVLTSISRSTSDTIIDSSAYNWFGNTDAGDVVFTLPPGRPSRAHRLVNTGTSGNDLIIRPDGTDNVLGQNTDFLLADGESLILVYDEVEGWY